MGNPVPNLSPNDFAEGGAGLATREPISNHIQRICLAALHLPSAWNGTEDATECLVDAVGDVLQEG